MLVRGCTVAFRTISFTFCSKVSAKCHSGESVRCCSSRPLSNILLILHNALTARLKNKAREEQSHRVVAAQLILATPAEKALPTLGFLSWFNYLSHIAGTWHFVFIEHILLNPNSGLISQLLEIFIFKRKGKKKKSQGVATAHVYWEPSVTPLIKTYL